MAARSSESRKAGWGSRISLLRRVLGFISEFYNELLNYVCPRMFKLEGTSEVALSNSSVNQEM